MRRPFPLHPMTKATNPPPELAPTFLSLKAFYAALITAVFGVSAFLALLLADSGLSNLWHDRTLLGSGLLLVGLFVLSIGVLFLIPALAQLRLAIQLEMAGKIVEGMLIEKRLEKDKKGNRFCYVVYAIDENFRFKQAIPQETYLRLKEGDKVNVRCLPKDTSIARLENPNA
jgi:asparagine N-glycosylation enzyme membrane subunit Stt3